MQHLVDDEMRERYSHRIESVPWLGFDHDTSRQYPIVPLDQYPQIRGWTEESIDLLRTEEPFQSSQALAMLQSWLFFGLLEIILDRHVPTKDFIVQTERGSMLTTTALRVFLDEYCAFLQAGGMPRNHTSFKNHMRIKHESLVLSQTWNRVLFSATKRCVSSLVDSMNHIVRMTALCADALFHTDFLLDRGFRNPDHLYWLWSDQNEEDLIHRLRLVGWCPVVFNQLRDMCRCVAEMAAIFGPSDLPSPSLVHDACTTEECYIDNVDVESWKPIHTQPPCHCENLKGSVEQLEQVLKQGNFGLLDIDVILNHENDGKCLFVPYKTGIQYVAFSHVWSQGLGSTADNGLPRCQLLRLAEMITDCRIYSGEASADVPRLLWIDSLCIPQNRTAKSKAISQMATIYTNAAITIVIDTSLQTIKYDEAVFKDSSSAQDKLLIQIAASAWNRRLWTFQEGVLSRNLCFMLLDTPLSGACIYQSLRDENKTMSPQTHRIFSNVIPILSAVRTSFGIGLISKTLKQRSTSDPSDETLAIAPLLNVDVGSLTALNDEERMCHLLKECKHLPSDVIYSSEVKLDVEGYRWAPRTILQSRPYSSIGMSMRPADATATVSERGIRGHFLMAVLSAPIKLSRGPYYRLLNENNKIMYGFVINSWQKNPEYFECAAIAFRHLPTSRLDFVRAVGLSMISLTSSGDRILKYEASLSSLRADGDTKIPGKILMVKDISEMKATIT